MRRSIRQFLGAAGSTAVIAAVVLLVAGGVSYGITNGQPDGDAHPYVGLVVADMGGSPAWRATGFLISPTVLVTSGHLTDGADGARVWFEADLTGNTEYPYGGSTSTEGTPYTHPEFCMGCAEGLPGFDTHDVGVIVLDEPVYLSEYAELPAAGLVETLSMMTDVDLVGYGLQYQERGGGLAPVDSWRGERTRNTATARLITSQDRLSEEFIKMSANPAQGNGGATYGDTGGPVLLGGTNTVLANISFFTNANTAGVTYGTRSDTQGVLDWINSF
jgi:hypothetical protein